MLDDVIALKAESLERCIERAREELAASSDFATDFTRQDAAILNIERACDATIDIADRIIRLRGLGPPSSARDSFSKLEAAGIVDSDLAGRLSRMGFRNIAVHQYHKLDIEIVEAVIEKRLDDLLEFSAIALRLSFAA
jgi:uncharacterized protein YutE (UPF0331/DUF86 family)